MKVCLFAFAIFIAAAAATPTPAPALASDKFSIIFFEDRAELPLKANSDLDKLLVRYQKLKAKKRFVITAYAVLSDKPSWGAFRLSLLRALLVHDYLISRNVPLKHIILRPKGNVCEAPCQRADVALR